MCFFAAGCSLSVTPSNSLKTNQPIAGRTLSVPAVGSASLASSTGGGGAPRPAAAQPSPGLLSMGAHELVQRHNECKASLSTVRQAALVDITRREVELLVSTAA